MKKTILACAFVITSALVCSSDVLAKNIEVVAKKSNVTLLFEELKDWIFSSRSSSTSGAKAMLNPDDTAPPVDPPPPPPPPQYCGRDCTNPNERLLKP